MKENNNTLSSRLVFGIILILVGGLLMLDNYDIFQFSIPAYIFDWRSILIIIGALILLTSRNSSSGVILIVIGVIGYIPDYWPILLILLGLYIIVRQSKFNSLLDRANEQINNPKSENIGEDYFNDVAIFGGGKKIITSSNLKGGKITAIFGGSEIDLYDCTLAPGVNYIDVIAIFGGATIIVPRGWKIEFDIVPIFGGFSDERRKTANVTVDSSRKLVIKGIALFGGGEVKD